MTPWLIGAAIYTALLLLAFALCRTATPAREAETQILTSTEHGQSGCHRREPCRAEPPGNHPDLPPQEVAG